MTWWTEKTRLTADKNAIQDYLCYTDDSTAFHVCCGVCAGFYDCVINVVDKFRVWLSIDANNLDSEPKLMTTEEWCVARVTNLFFRTCPLLLFSYWRSVQFFARISNTVGCVHKALQTKLIHLITLRIRLYGRPLFAQAASIPVLAHLL